MSVLEEPPVNAGPNNLWRADIFTPSAQLNSTGRCEFRYYLVFEATSGPFCTITRQVSAKGPLDYGKNMWIHTDTHTHTLHPLPHGQMAIFDQSLFHHGAGK